MTASPSIVDPKHKLIRDYYGALKRLSRQGASHEGALSTAFQSLLDGAARLRGWTLIPQLSSPDRNRPDGTLQDEFRMPRGYWEAKDPADDLDAAIRQKIARGYPLKNTIFENAQRAVLFQNGERLSTFTLGEPSELALLLNQFLSHTEPEILDFEQAVAQFRADIPQLAEGLRERIAAAHRDNPEFRTAFEGFYSLCQASLNPNLRREAVDEMLVQHLLTERLFRTVFDNPDFTRKNVIAAEIESVIDALTRRAFSRDQFFKRTDYFYKAIERAARTVPDYAEKQQFLNTVYEQFFQGWCVRTADTHGIVYTPQPIVDFMCASVEEVLREEFGLSLGDPGVCILDPCTGTGNFVVNLLRRISARPAADVPRAAFRQRSDANAVSLLR